MIWMSKYHLYLLKVNEECHLVKDKKKLKNKKVDSRSHH